MREGARYAVAGQTGLDPNQSKPQRYVAVIEARARAEGIYVFALGYGPSLLTKRARAAARSARTFSNASPTSPMAERRYDSKQPVGVYGYAATINDIKPCYAQLASAILRIAK
ncbi:hypothetical protein [Paraburkholderia azotifigens]|uniref:hypothetical protein n=1 Tax=Paraburkholderia azotifigens TaxID=2057004 RepID=UPI001F01DAC3|nr:hypothetical protein [Paraburkholderia azotifigens]